MFDDLSTSHPDDLDAQTGSSRAILLTQPSIPSPASCTGIVNSIVMEYRRYEDLRRARQRIEQQVAATCRSLCDGDKAAGLRLAATILRGEATQASLWFRPYLDAIEPLATAIEEQETALIGLARKLPVWSRAKQVSGLGPRFLAMILGCCREPIGEYKSVAAVWKRMGLAVLNGERQRRVCGDAALEHGYDARRRALMWNIGNSLLKAQVRNPKGPDGKPTGEATAIGPLGQVYLDRKSYERDRGISGVVAHARAKRFIEKRLLRELYAYWRQAEEATQP